MDTTLVIHTYLGDAGVEVPAFNFKGNRVAQCEVGPAGGWRTLTLADGTRTQVTLREIQRLSDAGDDALHAVLRAAPDQEQSALGASGPSPLSDPALAVDHVRRVARETADRGGYHAAALAVMDLRDEYRLTPRTLQEASPEQVEAWRAVRMETRALVPMAMGARGGSAEDAALFRRRVTTPASDPLPKQPGWAPDPLVGLQSAALRSPTAPHREGPPRGGEDEQVPRNLHP